MLKKGLVYSMNKYVKQYLHIGLIFSGLGPVTLGVIYLILNASGTEIVLSALDVFKAILTTYVIAFVQAGSSTFARIESWSKFKVMAFQGLSIYLVYLIGYLINDWIPFSLIAIGIYTGVFVIVFVSIWITIYAIATKAAKKMTEKLNEAKEKVQ